MGTPASLWSEANPTAASKRTCGSRILKEAVRLGLHLGALGHGQRPHDLTAHMHVGVLPQRSQKGEEILGALAPGEPRARGGAEAGIGVGEQRSRAGATLGTMVGSRARSASKAAASRRSRGWRMIERPGDALVHHVLFIRGAHLFDR